MESKVNRNLYSRFFKRSFDFISALGAFIVLSPLFLVVWILIRIKLGTPVLFKQKRPGKDEKVFTIYKFRSMSNEKDEHGEFLPDYIRLTTFGKFLRKSSLDELPELFNIIKGEMSLVGPRPLALDYLPYYRDNERLRHLVLPGLTGLAQIKGRNFLSWEDRFAYDVFYVKNLSFSLDLKILAETFLAVAQSKDSGVRGVDYSENSLDIVRGNEQGSDYSFKQHEIGSEFWFDEGAIGDGETAGKNSLLSGEEFLNFSGRGSLSLILNSIEKLVHSKIVLLPGYICNSVLQPFLDQGYQCIFYDIKQTLEPDMESVKNGLKKNPGVFFHLGYFGFRTNKVLESTLEEVRKPGTFVIEDVTHSFFTREGPDVRNDYEFGSIRKWAGMLSGAMVWPKKNLDDIKLAENSDFLSVRRKAMELKGRYMRSGRESIKKQYLKLFQESQVIIDQDTEPYAVDKFSIQIINNLNVTSLAAKRRKNYNALLRDLSGFSFLTPVFSECSEGIVPLFFPVFVKENRDDLRKYLRDREVYCPIHWEKPSVIDSRVLDSSDAIYNRILSIPCDQRYGVGDMERIVNLIHEYRG